MSSTPEAPAEASNPAGGSRPHVNSGNSDGVLPAAFSTVPAAQRRPFRIGYDPVGLGNARRDP
jgi:hypothetical protein